MCLSLIAQTVAVGLEAMAPPFTSAVSLTRWAIATVRLDGILCAAKALTAAQQTLYDSASSNITALDALSFATTNLEKLVGVTVPNGGKQDWVAVEHGSILDVGASRVVAVGTGGGNKGEVLLY